MTVQDAAPGGLAADIARELDELTPGLLALSHDIHEDPEVSFAEQRTSARIVERLEAGGFAVERAAGGLPTAFVGTKGSGDLVAALCVEYDALPGVGHACGHNLIMGASLGAALALAPFVEELGITLKVVGTPAEEHGGGKIVLLERGVFDDAALALMTHLVPEGSPYNPVGTTSQAVGRYRVTFHGRASHAAAAPHQGVNAADAAVLSQVAIGLLRQQIPGDHRVAMLIREAGEATNIIPATAVVDFEVRAYSMPEYDALLERVTNCFAGAALATGCTHELVQIEPVYEPLRHDPRLCALWADAIGRFGHDVAPSHVVLGGSTDMGNVSGHVPAIHPWVSIPGATDAIHTPGFAQLADTQPAYDVMLQSAAALAWTVAAAAQDGAVRADLIAEAGRRPAYRTPGTPAADLLPADATEALR